MRLTKAEVRQHAEAITHMVILELKNYVKLDKAILSCPVARWQEIVDGIYEQVEDSLLDKYGASDI